MELSLAWAMEQQSPRQGLLAQFLVRIKWRSPLARSVSHGSEVKGQKLEHSNVVERAETGHGLTLFLQ